MEEDAGEGVLEVHRGTQQTGGEEGADDVDARAEGEKEEGVGEEGVGAVREDGERGEEGEVGEAVAEGEELYLQSSFVFCAKAEPRRWAKEADLPCTPPPRTTSLQTHGRLHSTPVEIHGQSL